MFKLKFVGNFSKDENVFCEEKDSVFNPANWKSKTKMSRPKQISLW